MVPEPADQAQAPEAGGGTLDVPRGLRLQGVLVAETSGRALARHPDGRLELRLDAAGPTVVTPAAAIARDAGARADAAHTLRPLWTVRRWAGLVDAAGRRAGAAANVNS